MIGKIMWKTNAAKISGYMVTLLGLLSVIGWALAIDWLKIISSRMAIHVGHMEFLAAICFVLAGIMLVLSAKIVTDEDRFGIIEILLPIFSLLILLVMSTLLFSVIIDIDYHITGEVIEEVMMQPIMGMGIGAMTGSVGLTFPPVVTMLSFVLISLSGLFMIIDFQSKERVLLLISWFVMIIGVFALIGHIINYPMMYYHYDLFGRSFPPMAADAALLFVIWGLGMIFCLGDRNAQHSN